MTQTMLSMNEALRVIEAQKRVINSLEHEVRWYEGIIFNSSFNEVDIRLIAKETPLEMKMGISAEIAAERKVYMPAIAQEVHASSKTVSKRMRHLQDSGVFAYRTAPDAESGNTRSYLQPLAPLEQPATITIDRTKAGGSSWQDGKRVKRCQECDSPHLVRKTTVQIICSACGTVQEESSSIHQVNKPEDLLADAEEETQDPDSHNDTEPLDPDSHNDTEPCAPDAGPNVPSTTVSTVGVRTELVEPPLLLRERTIWCCHRAKQPYQPWGRSPQPASVDDPETWGTYQQAERMYDDSVRDGWKRPFDGIGLMCDGSFTVLDYDHCIENGQIDAARWAQIERVTCYKELSYSETGVHGIALGTIPRGRKTAQVEMYSGGPHKGRFLTWTGKHIIGTPGTIENQQEQITALYEEITPAAAQQTPQRPMPAGTFPPSTDEEILSKARAARNGAKFTALWQGNTAGYTSTSEADLALCSLLAYWTDGDVDSIDRLFRQSGLMRGKWERPEYREWTLSRALQQKREAA